MKCEYLRKLCKKDCENYVCRAFFPEKQPWISPRDLEMCMNYAEDCLRREEGIEYHKQRLKEKRDLHCKYASNTVCGKPWLWMCKGHVPPFILTPYEHIEGKPMVPKRDDNGEIIFKYDPEIVKNTCFSGKQEVYEACPSYKAGEEFHKRWMEVKGLTSENSNI